MTVLVQNQQCILRIDLREIRRKAQRILQILRMTKKELSILLTDDSTIAELNEKYLHRARPTNVIAFSMQQGPFSEIAPDILGDVVISVETARRQAQEAGLSLNTFLEKLLVHGVLHLVGYDHEGPEAEVHRMEEREEKILQALRTERTPLHS